MEDFGEANSVPDERTFSGNNGYRRGNAATLSPTNPGSANMGVAPEWKVSEGRIFSEIGEYSLETTDIDVGTPKRSAQPTRGGPTCA